MWLRASSLSMVGHLAERHANITVHIDSADLCALMVEADLAVGAAGSTSWERCCLGLPTVLLVLAENQQDGAAALAASGSAMLSPTASPEGITILTADIAASPRRLAEMAAAAGRLTDGQGLRRCMARISGLTLTPATLDHARIVWEWRNDPVTRSVSRDTSAIPWPAHEAWFARALGDTRRTTLIASGADVPCGMVRFDEIEATSDQPTARLVSINLNPAVRGQGLGGLILGEALDHLRAIYEGPVVAEIAMDNTPSRRIFTAVGFIQTGDPDGAGFARYAYSN